MPNDLVRAVELSKFVLKWHECYGKDLSKDLPTGLQERYLSTLSHLQHLEPNSYQTAQVIAQAQYMGIFEHFYGIEVPEWFLRVELGSLDIYSEVYIDTNPNHKPSITLGDISHLIEKLLLNYKEDSYEKTDPFILPNDWQKEPVYLKPAKVSLAITSKDQIRENLRDFFADFADLEEQGLGGRELMVSMNEDILEGDTNTISVYSPASFDFQLSVGEGTIVGLLVEQQITIEDVTLGCSDKYENSPE